MIGTVVEVSLETYYGITRERSLEDSVSEALFNCGEEALGNYSSESLSQGENSIHTSPN